MKILQDIIVRLILEQLDPTGYHLFVNAKVNNKRCRFLLDTGASHTVIDKQYFEKNFGKRNLRSVNQSTTGLHSSTVESHFGMLKNLSIGKLAIKSRMVAAIDLSHVNKTYKMIKKPKIHGILGSDLLLQFKMVIDYGELSILVPRDSARKAKTISRKNNRT